MTDVIKIKIDGIEWKGDEEPEVEANPYEMKLISGEFYEGHTVTVKLMDGKEYTRKVRDQKLSGLYITIKGIKYFDTDIIKD